jgi:hypothetical protein
MNPGFELDADGNGRPDDWVSNTEWSNGSRVTRSSEVVRRGTYSMRHSASDNSSYVISQSNLQVTMDRFYSFLGWVNIPSTSDVFLLQFEVQWYDGDNRVISTSAIKTYTTHTSGTWELALASFVAPELTTHASFRMVVSSLNTTFFVDDVGVIAGNFITRPAPNGVPAPGLIGIPATPEAPTETR